ncbi:hypothetical protein [Streptomyces noursei]|uniref:hypothetical protein n=1 Tax=Streptomyces noursei TaxID=1971 RepID=UPI001672BD93|nr:hypothetical protein [Streptomyces noursei]MCZ1019742.1 hypothetical protein [Streptomyces noursei]GGX50893.1 hypothetical protein GCM10010341_85560 [Streptomyces noursei]
MESKTQKALPELTSRVDEFIKTHPEAPEKIEYAKELVTRSIESGSVVTHLDQGREVDYSAAAVHSGNGTDIFTAPLTGGPATTYGAITVAIQDGKISGYREIQLTGKTPTTGTVQTWLNGKADLTKDVAESDGSQGAGGVSTKSILDPDWWHSFNSCLSAQGVPAWVIVGIEAAVGLACGASDGLACVLAAAASPAIASTVVGYCGAWASDHEGQDF